MTQNHIEKIYLDMDGVLADFESSFLKSHGVNSRQFEKDHGTVRFWETIYEDPQFFINLVPFQHARALYELCTSIAKTVILSSPSKVNTSLCTEQKRKWLDYHLGNQVPAIFDSDKHRYATPTRILIDDTESKIAKWKQAGGIGHLFTSYEECVKVLVKGKT